MTSKEDEFVKILCDSCGSVFSTTYDACARANDLGFTVFSYIVEPV